MQSTITMNEQEREVLLELLTDERRELYPEIRHTDSAAVREHLKDRLVLVDHLLDRLQAAPVR